MCLRIGDITFICSLRLAAPRWPDHYGLNGIGDRCETIKAARNGIGAEETGKTEWSPAETDDEPLARAALMKTEREKSLSCHQTRLTAIPA